MYKISKKGIDLIKSFEGLSLRKYVCSAGKLTIGYGTVVDKNFPNVITENEAEDLLIKCINDKEKFFLNYNIKTKFLEHEYDVLISFLYNVGSFGKGLLECLQKGDRKEIGNKMLLYNKIRIDNSLVVSKGLANRRKKEVKIFLEGY